MFFFAFLRGEVRCRMWKRRHGGGRLEWDVGVADDDSGPIVPYYSSSVSQSGSISGSGGRRKGKGRLIGLGMGISTPSLTEEVVVWVKE